MVYRIYTDGSTRGNGKENAVGGWAYVVINENGEETLFSDEYLEIKVLNRNMIAAKVEVAKVKKLVKDNFNK